MICQLTFQAVLPARSRAMQSYMFLLRYAYWSICTLAIQTPSSFAHRNFHTAADLETQQGEQTSSMRASDTSYIAALAVDFKLAFILTCVCVCVPVLCLCFFVICRRPFGDSGTALDKMDDYTIGVINVFASASDPLTDDMLDSASVDLHGDVVEKKLHIGKHEFMGILEDDITGKVSMANAAFSFVMRNQHAFPLTDILVDITDQGELEQIKESTGLSLVYPIAHHSWTEMTSDEAMERYFFYGPGALFVRDVEAAQQAAWPQLSKETAFVADCSDMATHDVRPGFRRYGALASFDACGGLLQIIDVAENRSLDPSDGLHWEHAKHLLKQSFHTRITAEHLLNIHMVIANTVVTAYVKHLPPRHIIRRLLTPFTLNATRINNASYEVLFPHYGLLHRTTGFTYSALISFLETTVSPSCFQTFPQQVEGFGSGLAKLAATGEYPLISDGLEFFSVVRCFVDAWVARGFASDEALRQDLHVVTFWQYLVKNITSINNNGHTVLADAPSVQTLVDVLAQFIWSVTAYHELVGAVVEFTNGADGFGLRARPFPATRTDLQSWVLTASLVATSSRQVPHLMSRFPNYFEGDEVLVWTAFLNDLEKVAKRIDDLNSKRRYHFNWFNPRFLQCSASL